MATPQCDTQHLERLKTYWKQDHAFPSKGPDDAVAD